MARALLTWLAQPERRHAAHVQWLEMHLSLGPHGTEVEERGLTALVASCVTACDTAGQLQELVLDLHPIEGPLAPFGWLPPLHSLQELSINCGSELRLTVAATALPALQRLQLSGTPVVFEAAARLPPSIIDLSLSDLEGEEMPLQVSWPLSRQ